MKNVEIYQHIELDGSSFYLGEGDTAVLCLHGFTATTTEVRPVAEYLAAHGYSTAAPLLPGHGTSPQDLNSKTYQDWVLTASDSLEKLAKNHKHVFVLGESMGALIALYLLAHYPFVSGGLIFAPALRIPRLWQSKLFWPLIKMMPKGGDGDDSMPWKGYNILPLKAAASLFDFQRVVQKELYKINQPLLVFLGQKDQRIDPLGAVIVLDRVNSKNKELVMLPESGHVILLDKETPVVFKMSHEFLVRFSSETEGESFGL